MLFKDKMKSSFIFNKEIWIILFALGAQLHFYGIIFPEIKGTIIQFIGIGLVILSATFVLILFNIEGKDKSNVLRVKSSPKSSLPYLKKHSNHGEGNSLRKLFSSLHDRKKSRYPVYYSTVLVIVTITAVLLVSGNLEITVIEGTMIFFEGFVSLFMLARHDKVGNDFMSHLIQVKNLGRTRISLIIIVISIAGITLLEKSTNLISKIILLVRL